MTNKEKQIAEWMIKHDLKDVLTWNFCLLYYDKLDNVFNGKLYDDNKVAKEIEEQASKDTFNRLMSFDGKFRKVDKSNNGIDNEKQN